MPPSSSFLSSYTMLDSIKLVPVWVGRKTGVLKQPEQGFATDKRVTLAA